MVTDRAFIFPICIPWGKTIYFVPKSRSSAKVKVKYQGQFLEKKCRCGNISVSQIQLVFLLITGHTYQLN